MLLRYLKGLAYNSVAELRYYNSFVLHPMFVECQEVLTDGGKKGAWNIGPTKFDKGLKRMQRYGVILERLISPEASFPVFGRSITYRTGVLQPLVLLALRGWLPITLSGLHQHNRGLRRRHGMEKNFLKIMQ